MKASTGAVVFRRPVDRERPVFAKFPVDLFGDPAVAEALRDQIVGKIVLIGADLPEADRFLTPLSRCRPTRRPKGNGQIEHHRRGGTARYAGGAGA